MTVDNILLIYKITDLFNIFIDMFSSQWNYTHHTLQDSKIIFQHKFKKVCYIFREYNEL